jgi:putative endonuclease
MKSYYIYIMSSLGGTLYTGVTTDIWNRVLTDKQKKKSCFTNKYNITRLVYYEETRYIQSALARENEIKCWRRKKKIQLIESLNPKWRDIAESWYSGKDIPPQVQ